MPRTAVTTPIRNLAQPYPLVNKLTDGDMEAAGTGAWYSVRATLTKETANPKTGTKCLRATYNGSTTPGGTYQSVLGLGTRFMVTGWARGDGTTYPVVGLGSYVAPAWTGTTSTEWQRFNVVADNVSGSGNFLLYGYLVSAGHYVEFDDVQVIDLTATPTRQLGQPFTPVNVLTGGDGEIINPAVALVDGDMEAAGVAAWTVGGGSTLSKDGTTKVSGTQSLKIAGAQYAYASQPGILTSGRTYKITASVRGDGTGYVVIKDNGAGGAWITGTTSTDWQTTTAYVRATGTALVLYQYGAGTNSVWVDDITITDVTTGFTASPLSAGFVTEYDSVTAHGGNRVLRVIADGTLSNCYFGAQVLTVGHLYLVTGWARGDGTRRPIIGDGDFTWIGSTSTSWQKFYKVAVAKTAYIYFYAYNTGGAGTYAEFDDVEIIDLSATPMRLPATGRTNV